MFDLTFQPSVLDKMPVGTSFKDSDHVVTKKNEGWECEECYSSTPEPSSSAYMSTPSQEITMEKFAGAEIDPDDLDPRLLAFLPAGTKVADSESLWTADSWHWSKTKTGRWIWIDRKPGLTFDDDGVSVENLISAEHLRPFRLISIGTDDTLESDEAPVRLTAAEAADLRGVVYDNGGWKWVYTSEEGYRMELPGNVLGQLHKQLSADHAPYFTEDPGVVVETEPEPEPEIELTAEEASPRKDTVFKDSDGDTWFFDFGLWQWRAMGPGWAFAKEKLDSIYSPYTKVGPLSEFVRVWTAEEASNFKDAALEDNDGDIWIYDVPSERWKCSADGAPDGSELKKGYQPYRIKRDGATVRLTAAPGSAIFLGYDEPFQSVGGTEEVTLEGSAKEAVELLDRIARSLESIDRKLGDK